MLGSHFPDAMASLKRKAAASRPKRAAPSEPAHTAKGLYDAGMLYIVLVPGKLRVYGSYSDLADTKARVVTGGAPGRVLWVEFESMARVGPFLARPSRDGTWTLTRHDDAKDVTRLLVTDTQPCDAVPSARQKLGLDRRIRDLETPPLPGAGPEVVRATFSGERVWGRLAGSAIYCYDCLVEGSGLVVRGDRNVVRGDTNTVVGDDNYAIGEGVTVNGFGSLAIGRQTTTVFALSRDSTVPLRVLLLSQAVQIRTLEEHRDNFIQHSARLAKSLADVEASMRKLLLDRGQPPRNLPPPTPEAAAAALACTVCMEWACDQVLSCGHLFCTACVLRLPRDERNEFACPRCRATTKFATRVFT